MSRPFTYNDENFTVIGNVLFIHIKSTVEVPAGGVIATLPPAILDRLIQRSCYGNYQRDKFGVNGGMWGMSIKSNGDIYCDIKASKPPEGANNYFNAYVFLKDI